jgi:aspartate oxidase
LLDAVRFTLEIDRFELRVLVDAGCATLAKARRNLRSKRPSLLSTDLSSSLSTASYTRQAGMASMIAPEDAWIEAIHFFPVESV